MFRPTAPGCAHYVDMGAGGSPGSCPASPDYAATWREPRPPRRLWRVFLCEQHRREYEDRYPDARPLTENDQTALDLRKKRWDDAIAGRGWVRPGPLPPE